MLIQHTERFRIIDMEKRFLIYSRNFRKEDLKLKARKFKKKSVKYN
jgi:hypothetical protein